MKLFFLFLIGLWGFSFKVIAQSKSDSVKSVLLQDSARRATLIQIQKEDSFSKKYENVITRIFGQNKFVNLSSQPVNLINKEKEFKNKDILFYILSAILLLLGILKLFYLRYFNNIFRVFFNTSLRQNQLTDLLLQAKLASLIFNIFFVASAGLYTWALLTYYRFLPPGNNYIIISGCIAALGLVYLGKFFSLKFIGWVSGMSEQSDIYIFITFLINKILGIILLPFTIIIIFGTVAWANAVVIISLLIICIFFLSRYFRSYSLLQNQLKLTWFQFLVYILAVEIVPILIIYKTATSLLA